MIAVDVTAISVQTSLRKGSGFVPVADASARIDDPDYIEGAIELRVGDVELLSVAQWDLVDQLWSYLVQGLAQVLVGQPFACHFPDQPIPIAMELAREELVLTVGPRRAAAPVAELGTALLGEARRFFELLAQKDKRCRRDAKHELALIAKVDATLRARLQR